MVSARARIRAASSKVSNLIRSLNLSTESDRRLAEAFDQRHGGRKADRVRVERLKPRFVIVRSVAQPLLEYGLQFAETAIAESLGEAHEGRRLHGRLFGDAANRAKRNIVRKLNRIIRHLRQPLGHLIAFLDNKIAQFAKLTGRSDSFCI